VSLSCRERVAVNSISGQPSRSCNLLSCRNTVLVVDLILVDTIRLSVEHAVVLLVLLELRCITLVLLKVLRELVLLMALACAYSRSVLVPDHVSDVAASLRLQGRRVLDCEALVVRQRGVVLGAGHVFEPAVRVLLLSVESSIEMRVTVGAEATGARDRRRLMMLSRTPRRARIRQVNIMVIRVASQGLLARLLLVVLMNLILHALLSLTERILILHSSSNDAV